MSDRLIQRIERERRAVPAWMWWFSGFFIGASVACFIWLLAVNY